MTADLTPEQIRHTQWTVQVAKALAKRNYPVIPLHYPVTGIKSLICSCSNPNCSTPAKHPLTANGLHDGTTDPAVIENWWNTRPLANLGLVTGRIIVLDVDPRHNGDDSLRDLERQHGSLPHTWRILTGGGGEHVCFQPPPGTTIRNSANKLGDGLDIRGEGGYVVTVPSRHICGRDYTFSVDHHPQETQIAPLPPWLTALCETGANGRKGAAPAEWANMIREGVAEGGRNMAVARLSGHLFRKNVDAEVVSELVNAFNDARCQPPLEPAEIAKTLESIAAKELRRRGANVQR